VQRQQLLAESQIFQNEVLTGTESTENPTEKMAKSHYHDPNFTATRRTTPLSKRLIPQVCEVLTRHNPALWCTIVNAFFLSPLILWMC
jgi:hypothetical protein